MINDNLQNNQLDLSNYTAGYLAKLDHRNISAKQRFYTQVA